MKLTKYIDTACVVGVMVCSIGLTMVTTDYTLETSRFNGNINKVTLSVK